MRAWRAAAVVLALALPGLLRAQSAEGEAEPAQGIREERGDILYERICQACHMAGGTGASGAASYPALAGNPRLRDEAYVRSVVAGGSAGMPPFARLLTKRQIAAVVDFVRSRFGDGPGDAVGESRTPEP